MNATQWCIRNQHIISIISVMNHKSVSHSINQHKPHHSNHTKNSLGIHNTTNNSIHQDNNVTILVFQWYIWAHRMHIWNLPHHPRVWHYLKHNSSSFQPLYVPCPHTAHVCARTGSLQPTYVRGQCIQQHAYHFRALRFFSSRSTEILCNQFIILFYLLLSKLTTSQSQHIQAL